MSNNIIQAVSPMINGIVTHVLTPMLTLLGLASFVYFLWGVMLFIQNKSDPASKKIDDGKRHMIYGIIGLVVIFGANALVAMIKSIWG